MSGRGRGRGRGSTAPQGTGAGDDIAQAVRDLVATLARNTRNHTLGGEMDAMTALREFRRQSPPVFVGDPAPMVAENWIRQIDKILGAMGVTDDKSKVTLATFQFEGEADQWWAMIKGSRDVTTMTWIGFKELFLGKYFPTVVRNTKVQEFLELKQKGMTVSQYEAKFSELSRFAPHLVGDKEAKARKFEWGLIPTIRGRIVGANYHTYEEVVNVALLIEREMEDAKTIRETSGQQRRNDRQGENVAKRPRVEGVPQRRPQRGRGNGSRVICFQCGQPGHLRSACPQQMVVSSQVTSSAPQRVCFQCGQTGHFRNQCPQLAALGQAQSALGGPSSQQRRYTPPVSSGVQQRQG